MDYSKGSEWRKWDLHIHTPASLISWNGTKHFSDMDPSEKEEIIQKIIQKFNESDIAVFCIMDYWTFDGYIEIRNFLESHPEIPCNSTILPGIELRIQAPSKERLNIHAILSDKLSIQKINDFKNELRLLGVKRPLSIEALQDFAKGLDKGTANHHGYKDPKSLDETKLTTLGYKTAEITIESLESAKNILPKNSCLIMLPYDTHGGAEGIYWQNHPASDSYFMKLADLIETRNEDNIDLFLGITTDKNEKYIEDFQNNLDYKSKPVVSGSDAHAIKDYGDFPNGKITWIKADPTFKGLRQTTFSPKSRTYIGTLPDQLKNLSRNKNRFIKNISATKLTNDLEEDWFDNISLDLNSGLVAIIGNKGMGKSALADIVGLLGNSHAKEYFSFLTRDKFLGIDKKKGMAHHFESSIVWHNDTKHTKILTSDIDHEKKELVRYVPQNFFEKICNESEIKPGGLFSEELEKIIFSHVEEYKKNDVFTLKELIKNQTEQHKNTIEELKIELNKKNEIIIKLSGELSNSSKHTINTSLTEKLEELQNHLAIEPLIPEQTEENTDTTKQLAGIQNKIKEKNCDLADLIDRQSTIEKKNQAAKKIKQSSEDLERKYNLWLSDHEEEFILLELEPNSIISFDYLYKIQLDQLISTQQLEQSSLLQEKETLENDKRKLEEQETGIKNKLSTNQQEYTLAIEQHSQWEEDRKRFSKEIDELEKKIEYLENQAPIDLKKVLEEREIVFIDIFNEKQKMSDIYLELYKPVKEFIEKHSKTNEKYKLGFESELDLTSSFSENFFFYIKQNVSGTYRQKEEGKQQLLQLIESSSFCRLENTTQFINNIIFSLEHNLQTDDSKDEELINQIKTGSLLDFYNFLYGLDYLEPRYSLKLDNKEMPKLSPGERGVLLLIFYLLIDKDTIPLIIDQPEENLDNQTIVDLLVPCIEEAKKNRQIIIVTHNPNLAVVCDADQIIHAAIDKENRNKVIYSYGSIENSEINKKIVDILEGTWKAFHKRESMYQIDSRILYTKKK